MPELGFQHVWEKGATGAPTLLVLHGTGGNELDLLPLARTVAPGWNLLSPLGKVREGQMARFFRRFAEGRFDEDDVRFRAQELAEFVTDASGTYGFHPGRVFALGYSNGANIAAAVLYTQPRVLQGGVLLRAMVPLAAGPAVPQQGAALLVNGRQDSIIPLANAQQLAAQLQAAGIAVQHEVLPTGHGLVQDDVRLAQQWLAGVATPSPAA